jgi:hypothetical protein
MPWSRSSADSATETAAGAGASARPPKGSQGEEKGKGGARGARCVTCAVCDMRGRSADGTPGAARPRAPEPGSSCSVKEPSPSMPFAGRASRGECLQITKGEEGAAACK